MIRIFGFSFKETEIEQAFILSNIKVSVRSCEFHAYHRSEHEWKDDLSETCCYFTSIGPGKIPEKERQKTGKQYTVNMK